MVRSEDSDECFSCFPLSFPYCPAKIIDLFHLFHSCQVCNILSRKVNVTVSNRQVNLRGGDAKRNIPERKNLSQQVKIFHASKTISSCRESLYPRLGGCREPESPLRPRVTADELGLTEPVPAWSAEAASCWDFQGKHPLSSLKTQPQCSLLSLSAPQHRALPCRPVPWSCPGSPIHSLCAFPSNEPTPFKGSHCGCWPPKFQSKSKSSPFLRDICLKWCLHHSAEHRSL